MIHDVIIRGGTIADGLGGDLYKADVAVLEGRIVAVGSNVGPGREEIDATGLLVTPGFVDIHTHYDGQVTWESRLSPSSGHGVTTVLTGNCGVGFAPCRSEDQTELIELMAGVEDIPEVVMVEGLSWEWESFSEYLDAVAQQQHDLDIAAMLPHSALRVYVMGERAVRREAATKQDIENMAELTRQAMNCGALGFGTSRSIQQKTIKGEPIPTMLAAEDELLGILMAMAEQDRGVFQLLSDFDQFHDVKGEFAMLRRLVAQTGRPTSFTLNQKNDFPDCWRQILELTESASNDGLPIRAQVLGRPTGIIFGHDLSLSPFTKCPTYQALAALIFDQRITELLKPEVRVKILEEVSSLPPQRWDLMFEMGDPPNYEPEPNTSLAARATREGSTPEALAYDVLLEEGGHQLLFFPIQNYTEGSLDNCFEMMRHRDTILGLGDGGAHCGMICDASYPTTMLAYWTRDRIRGPRLEIPEAVRALTSETAEAVGLRDRGRIVPGYKADLNVINYEGLRIHRPEVAHDLPAGGRRVIQRADGYVATMVSGVITSRDGVPTEALPGQLIRGPKAAPLAN